MSEGKAGSFFGAFFGAALGVVAGAFALGVIDLKRTKTAPADTLDGAGLGTLGSGDGKGSGQKN